MAQFPHDADLSSDSSESRLLPFPAGAPRRRAREDHDLSVIIPAYNEAARLPQTLDSLEEYLTDWGVDYRVLVVDDGSRDATAELVTRRGLGFDVLRQANAGKGAAVRNGILRSTGRIVAFTDADLPYHLDGLRAAYDSIAGGRAEVAFGARDLDGSESLAVRRFSRRLAHEVFRQVVSLMVSREVTDTQCGLKAFSRRAAIEIFSRTVINGFAFDAEVVHLTHRLGLPFTRIPVTLINEYGSTISLARHSLPMLWDVLRCRIYGGLGKYQVQASLALGHQPAEVPESVAAVHDEAPSRAAA